MVESTGHTTLPVKPDDAMADQTQIVVFLLSPSSLTLSVASMNQIRIDVRVVRRGSNETENRRTHGRCRAL